MANKKKCNCYATDWNLSTFSKNKLLQKSEIFLFGIQNRVNESFEYIEKVFPQKKEFYESIDFLEHCFLDAQKGEIIELSRLSFFSMAEAQSEMDQVIKLLLIGSYKSAYVSLRRFMELLFLHIHFAIEKKYKDAKAWLKSEKPTEFFKKTIKTLHNDDNFSEFCKQYPEWLEQVLKDYYKICDVLHVRGIEKGFTKLHKRRATYNNTHFESISTKSLEDFLHLFIKIVEHTAVALTLYSPVILVGFDIENKFTIEGAPITGFFHEGQSEILKNILYREYPKFFKDFLEHNEQIRSFKSFIDSLPNQHY